MDRLKLRVLIHISYSSFRWLDVFDFVLKMFSMFFVRIKFCIWLGYFVHFKRRISFRELYSIMKMQTFVGRFFLPNQFHRNFGMDLMFRTPCAEDIYLNLLSTAYFPIGWSSINLTFYRSNPTAKKMRDFFPVLLHK